MQRWNKVDMDARLVDAPPIRIDSLNDHHLLTMQAPHSGWMLSIDKDERVADGVRLYVTIRKPDPAFMYPQAIVEKQVLSDVQSETPIFIYARLLESDEKTKGRDHSELIPVDEFPN